LGNGFRIVEGKKTAILVIGGMGAPPIQCLAKLLTTSYSDIDVIVFAGAKTADQLPFENKLDEISQQLGFSLPEFARFGVKSQIATDDGSAGYHGLVTDCLEQWLRENSEIVRDEIIIYACGPEAMLAKVAKIAEQDKIDCQVSMERMMACGFGVCQSCAVECRVNGSNETVYKLCCEDGPVFDGRELFFSL
jgi:dihydroorotate dehydrogenase electron transfer subunit